ncbi:hypothetical protein Pst134EB_027337 [Puccinia striiformis f. sp. tritici]|nr:hypothetical protein Pst134EB_027337 [Puccinia striiformis f. sp. tritici]
MYPFLILSPHLAILDRLKKPQKKVIISCFIIIIFSAACLYTSIYPCSLDQIIKRPQRKKKKTPRKVILFSSNTHHNFTSSFLKSCMCLAICSFSSSLPLFCLFRH